MFSVCYSLSVDKKAKGQSKGRKDTWNDANCNILELCIDTFEASNNSMNVDWRNLEVPIESSISCRNRIHMTIS
ncbi:hypothetical protein RCL_jg9847.t1 [Rhizophagus clarus]|uniref:Uncharacterized protein n=1 Tax=Rhizophagus clarus TaxID=94130 RepID=A0A8H3QXX7_9GLOM|nr:hypothetical protein RCL_jg9847.t1 [Rhizophagus clarus]